MTSFVIGSQRLFDFVNDNPDATLEPIERICDPETLARLPALVSVTQAFAIDLSRRGRVAAPVI